jgi:hypothetical protein
VDRPDPRREARLDGLAAGRPRLRIVRRRLPGRRHAAAGQGARLRVVAIGARARRSLESSGGIAQPLAAFADSPWYEAGREIVWIGSRLPALHPRAVLTAEPPVRGRELRFESIPRMAWSPPRTKFDPSRIAAGARRLRKAAEQIGTPGGFGALLLRKVPAFPLDRAVPLVRALDRAFFREDGEAVLAAARPLLGLGAGLTPSGDDLVGGALFGLRLVKGADPPWQGVGRKLSREIRHRSHAVSAALFADLVAGRSFAPLHDLVTALAAGDDAQALAAARTLAGIGHSSGWDMLTGFLIGTRKTGSPTL